MNDMSDEVQIQRGVRLGCVESLTILNLYAETSLRHNLLSIQSVSKLNGKLTTILDMLMTPQYQQGTEMNFQSL